MTFTKIIIFSNQQIIKEEFKDAKNRALKHQNKFKQFVNHFTSDH